MNWENEIILPYTSRAELRKWLTEHARTATSCWVYVSMKPQTNTIQYLDVVEEALCFGWIDGVKKKPNPDQLLQRISPRSKKSNWTELNKERVRRLECLGLMTDQGRDRLPHMNPTNFTIHPLIIEALEKEPEALHFFSTFPKAYQRIRIDTIQSELVTYKRPDVFEKRLAKFIEQTKQNKMYGQWHDNGRLLENNSPHLS